MNDRFEAGGLLTTDHESVDLGEHHGTRLEGRIERRTLRIGIGGRRGLRLELARARPTAVSVTAALADGSTSEVVHVVRPNPDPWIVTGQRLLVLTVASALLPWLWRRRAGFAHPGSE